MSHESPAPPPPHPCTECRSMHTSTRQTHCALSCRLARLVKYSFYKNVAFAFLLFYFQFYNGFSGQALVDGISAAAYNVVFTSLPILLYAVLDRPVRHFSTLMRYPQVGPGRTAAAPLLQRAGRTSSRPAWPAQWHRGRVDAWSCCPASSSKCSQHRSCPLLEHARGVSLLSACCCLRPEHCCKLHCPCSCLYPFLSFWISLRPRTAGSAAQVYNKQGSLNTRVFWKSGVLMAAVDAALAFFIPYYSITASDHNSITDVYSVGKTVFIALLGAVSLEVGWLLFRC